jgi:hypothetical protein
MDIDRPEAMSEVRDAFERYERALMANNVAVLNAMFRDDARTIRYGTAENLYGHAEISRFRAARAPAGLERTLSRTVITTFGGDFAVASTLFHRPAQRGKIGRQTQAWVRFAGKWLIVGAHVSMIDEQGSV